MTEERQDCQPLGAGIVNRMLQDLRRQLDLLGLLLRRLFLRGFFGSGLTGLQNGHGLDGHTGFPDGLVGFDFLLVAAY